MQIVHPGAVSTDLWEGNALLQKNSILYSTNCEF